MLTDWEHFEHGADIGVRGYGQTLAEAFINAALAMTAVMVDPSSVRREVAIQVRCAAADKELLLAEWLNTIIYEMTTRKMLFAEFDVAFSDEHVIEATLRGEVIDVPRHQPAVEIKGATLTALCVECDKESGRWVAQTVVDV